MCGIAGIIYNQQREQGEGPVKRMTDSMAHRGPDGYGFWQKENVCLGHRRLAIIDLTEAGAQPMAYNGYVIVYNGEIYNYREVKNELLKLGYAFRSHSDTEVILAAYQCWGPGCLNRFNGMWAFAIYDPVKNIVFCSRDRFGVKPFYYTRQQDQFVFGSEIRSLLPFLSAAKANAQALSHYLAFSLTDNSDKTFFEDIHNLPGSHFLIYDLQSHGIDIKRYYSIAIHEEYQRLDYPETLPLFQQQFERAVNWRLRSDVAVGTCLSGGLDSSLIALAASKAYKNALPFCAFTAAATDPGINDAPYAKTVAETLGLDWHVTTPSADDFVKDVAQVCATMGEPVASPSVFMQHYVMRKASEQGLKVLLDGQGADETLLGYGRYTAALGHNLKGINKLRFFAQASKKYRLSWKELLTMYFYFANWPMRKRHAAAKLKGIRPVYFENIDEDFFRQLSDAYKDPLQLQQLEITSTQIPALLRYEDRNSMHYSIETRLPFLDWQLVELNLSMPVGCKMRDGWSKYPIRDSMKGWLPDSITWRPNKLGFNAPDKEWLTASAQFGEWIKTSPVLNQMFADPLAVARLENGMFWKLLNIACWEQHYNMVL